jgi:hypothetical protein
MKAAHVLSLLCGAAMMLGFSTLRGSGMESTHHVYELRMYHVNPGKMEALIARFADHTDALFKRHNMKSIGYWRPEDAPNSENLFIYVLEHPSREEAKKNWAAFQADPEWKEVKAHSETQDHWRIISIVTSWIRPAFLHSSEGVRRRKGVSKWT